MTIEPGLYELLIPQRATLEEGPFWLPFDGTGCEFFADVWDSDRRKKKLLSLTVVVDDYLIEGADPDNVDSIECQIRLTAPWTATKSVVKDGYWDLLVVFPDGERSYYLEGPARVNLNVTEATP